MWKSAPCQSAIRGTLVILVVACLSVVIASPSLLGAARNSRSRNTATALKATRRAVGQPTAGILSPDQQILIRLENGQRTLEKQTADINAALQRQVSQLSSAVEDSRKETNQLLQRTANVDSIQRLLIMVLALLVLIAGGVVYVAWQLPSLTGRGLARKGKAPVLELNGKLPDFPDDRELRSDEEGIVSLRVRPRNS
jgi:hypothetical protein